MNKLWLILGANLFLAACTSLDAPLQTQAPAQWQAQRDWQSFSSSGRFAVKNGNAGHSAHFDWRKENGVEQFDINTPLGNTVGQLCQDAQGAIAIDHNNRAYTAENAEALSAQLIGYPLPLQYLSVWANGEWVASAPHSFDDAGRLHQFGWQIEREANEDGTPSSLHLENAPFSLRMVFGDSERQAGNAPNQTTLCSIRPDK